MLFKYCGIIGLLVNIPITICITVIPPLPSPTSLLTLPLSPPSLSLPHPPSLPTLPLSPTSPPHPLSPPPLRPLPTLSPPSSLPSLQQIHCPFQPKQSHSLIKYYYHDVSRRWDTIYFRTCSCFQPLFVN